MPFVRCSERARREVLRRVRGGTDRKCRAERAVSAHGSRRRAPARHRPLRRPRRLHDVVRESRSRGGARASLALLRYEPAPDRALRRHRREVHRRRGDGRLGHADRDRGRRRASGPRRARSRRRRERTRRRGRRPRASGSSRSSHWRSRRHDRRRRPGHGRRRSRQHGLACAVGRRPGHRVRGRIHAALDRADDRLRGGRLVRAQGQGGTDPALEGAARRVRVARLAQVARARGPIRRARPRAASDQGPLPRLRRREEGPPRLRDRHRRHRQVAAGVGVLQVLRRHRRDRLLAPRALPLLRRGRDLLGARRHGAHALPHRRGGGPGVRAGKAARHAGGAHPRPRGARLPRAPARPPARVG